MPSSSRVALLTTTTTRKKTIESSVRFARPWPWPAIPFLPGGDITGDNEECLSAPRMDSERRIKKKMEEKKTTKNFYSRSRER